VLLENITDILISRHDRMDFSAVGIELERYGLKLSSDIPDSVKPALKAEEGISQRKKVLCGELVSWLLVQSILERESAETGNPVEDGLQLAQQHMASLAAQLPYIG
jgi:hypothetical protein